MLRFKHSARSFKQIISTHLSLTTPQSSLWLTTFNSRNFALFAGKPATTQQQQSAVKQDPRQKDYNDLMRSIDSTKRRIADKTKQGRSLSLQIAQDAEPEKYVRLQRYEIFINKME